MDSYILCGMQFGDEGKGTFVDYLTYKYSIDCIVRYNGGSHASHTVITPSGVTHKFSQLGSGMFRDECDTYLTENMVINLDNLMVELETFSNKTKIPIPNLIDRIHIHENCFIVTPYHKLINKLRELSSGDNRRGTVGTGVSEVKYLLDEFKSDPRISPFGVRVKDIFNTHLNTFLISTCEELQEYANDLYETNKKLIWQNVPEELKESLENEISVLLKPKAFFSIANYYIITFKQAPDDINLSRCLYTTYELSFRRKCKTAIFEGSQGLLIDGTYGIKPNTTFLDTSINFALDISYYKDNIVKIGIAKAFMSRHGLGIFPTECSDLSSKISDENQSSCFWNGKMRFGWFDGVLFRYAQKINQVDELYISSLDKLDGFETLQICNKYLFNGIPDEEFYDLFEYYESIDKLDESQQPSIVITDIKKNSNNLVTYLKQCTPIYSKVQGWNSDISNITSKSELPYLCSRYIAELEASTGLPITVISVGPTRQNKICLKSSTKTQKE